MLIEESNGESDSEPSCDNLDEKEIMQKLEGNSFSMCSFVEVFFKIR